jgi:hypothetical protein
MAMAAGCFHRNDTGVIFIVIAAGRFLVGCDRKHYHKQKGTRRGKSLVATGRHEIATGVVWACTAN